MRRSGRLTSLVFRAGDSSQMGMNVGVSVYPPIPSSRVLNGELIAFLLSCLSFLFPGGKMRARKGEKIRLHFVVDVDGFFRKLPSNMRGNLNIDNNTMHLILKSVFLDWLRNNITILAFSSMAENATECLIYKQFHFCSHGSTNVWCTCMHI